MPSDTILFITDVPFWREGRGAEVRIAALCRIAAAAGFEVALFSPIRISAADRRRRSQQFPDIRFFHPPGYLLLLRMMRRRLLPRFRASLPGESPAAPLTWERRHALRRCCDRVRPRIMVMSYLWNAWLLDGLPDPPPCMLDTHDIMHLRAARFSEQGLANDPILSREEESARMRPFDALLAIQAEEAQLLRAMCPGKPVITAGHAFPAHPPVFHEKSPLRLLFVAAQGIHNQATILGFLKEVWPALRRHHGDGVVLDIAGSIGESLRESPLPEGVSVLGFVQDLDALYAGADIVVNPVYAGSGLKIKNVEALCQGLPLVTTPVGAEGLGIAGESPCLIGDTPEAMIRAIDRLLSDPAERRRWAEAAHQFAARYLTEEAVYREFRAFLENFRRR